MVDEGGSEGFLVLGCRGTKVPEGLRFSGT